MTKSSAITGFVKPGFEAVREAFAENFERRNELGAACCIYYRGEKVVDLWGGVMNRTGSYLVDPRDRALRTALYRSLGEPDPYREGTQLKNGR